MVYQKLPWMRYGNDEGEVEAEENIDGKHGRGPYTV